MTDFKDQVYAFCQYCKEKRPIMKENLIFKNKTRLLVGQCLICRRDMKLIVPKNYKVKK